MAGARETGITDTDQLLDELRRQTPWIRLLGQQALRPALERALTTSKQRAVYDLSDGRSVREIAKAAGVGVGTVSRLWTEWATLGIVVGDPNHPGRWQRLTTIAAAGLAPLNDEG